MSEKKEKPRSSVFVAEVDRWLGNPALGQTESKDPVDRALEEAVERKVRRLKMLELDKYLQETEKEIKELRGEKEMKEEKEEKIDPLLVPYAVELSKLPDEQRNKVIAIVHALSSKEGSPLAWVVPLAMGVVKANPGEDTNSLLKTADILANQIKTGIEIGRQTQAQPQSNVNPFDGAVQLLKAFGEIMRENVQKPLEEAISRIQPQPSVFEQILLDDRLFQRAKELGLFGGHPQGLESEAALRLQKEIEQLKTEREMKLAELKQEHDKWAMEMQMEMKKWEQVGKLFEGPAGQFIQMIGGATADRIRGSGGSSSAQGTQIPGIKVEQITCPSCNKQFYVNALADYAICPHCAQVLQKKGPGGEPEGGAEAPAEGQ
jgi:hypothetical protein